MSAFSTPTAGNSQAVSVCLSEHALFEVNEGYPETVAQAQGTPTTRRGRPYPGTPPPLFSSGFAGNQKGHGAVCRSPKLWKDAEKVGILG